MHHFSPFWPLLSFLLLYSSYQIGVHCADDDSEPTFFNFNNATKCSYIAGEVPASEEEQEFVVGDGKEYGDFKNAPLMKGKEYDIYISIVTRTDKVCIANVASYLQCLGTCTFHWLSSALKRANLTYVEKTQTEGNWYESSSDHMFNLDQSLHK